MHQTTIYLDNASKEVVEKYFRGKMSMSAALAQVVYKYVREGFPNKMCGREVGDNVGGFTRYRVNLDEGVWMKVQGQYGMNLSFSLREYLKSTFL